MSWRWLRCLLFLVCAAPTLRGSCPQDDPANTPKNSARNFYQRMQAQWEPSVPRNLNLSQWRRPKWIAWSALLGNPSAILPCVEEVNWKASSDVADAAKVLHVRRDFLDFELGFGVGDQLQWIAVKEALHRSIPAQLVRMDLSLPLADQWPRPKEADSQPKADLFAVGNPRVAIPNQTEVGKRYEALLNRFRNSEALHFDASAVLKIAQQDSSIEVGDIQMQLRFVHPGFGALSMQGWIGAEKHKVHSQILGTEQGLIHVDHVKKRATGDGSFEGIAEGMLGFAPLAAWAGLEVERAIDVRAINVPGHEYGWTGFQVESKHLITVYRFDPHDRLVGAAVVPKDPGGTRQVMEYRFHGLELPKVRDPKPYQLTSPYPLEAIGDSLKEAGMLAIGAQAPAEFPHSNSVVFFWLDGGPQEQQVLDQLRRQWREVSRLNPDLPLIKIPASQATALQAYRVRYFPSFYVIDADGKIVDRFVGWDTARLTRAARRL